ncbi:hypothetical protein U5640_11730 [Streptomyces sp. SS7]|uniref:hypothetical protein n=1 Tax=Streptomyces sp. SS7 TaxID=3108485 RepID=UPI0030EEA1A0
MTRPARRLWKLYADRSILKAAEQGPWPKAKGWQVQDLDTDFFGTMLQQLVDACDEQFTGTPQFRYGSR